MSRGGALIDEQHDKKRLRWFAIMLVLAAALGKKRISIMLDSAIIDYFKAAAGDRGYQTLINDTLRKAVAGEQMIEEVRHVVRQELAAYRAKK